MNKQISTSTGIALVVAVSIVFIVALSKIEKSFFPGLEDPFSKAEDNKKNIETENESSFEGLTGDTIEKFKSEEEFKKYLDENRSQRGGYGMGGGPEMMIDRGQANVSAQMKSSDAVTSSGMAVPSSAPAPEFDRVSNTNVQVLGIDEPDAVKTNGKDIFFAQPEWLYNNRVFYSESSPKMISGNEGRMISIPPIAEDRRGQVKIIKATPVADAEVLSTIEKSGEMILSENTLIIMSENKSKIYGYDVSDSKNPKEKWAMELKEGNSFIGARLYGDKVYLATQKAVEYYGSPCPIRPLTYGSGGIKKDLEIGCQEIYHPINPVPSEVTYSLISFNSQSGQVISKTSFVGPWSDSAVYMSQNAIYLTYNYPGDFVGILSGFLAENKDLFPSQLVDKINKISNYDLSNNAKFTEIQTILSNFTNSLDRDESLRINNEISNRIGDYLQSHGREMEKTGIVKVNLNDLEIVATGKVPGKLLNQFSLDEFNDNLRVATTFGNASWWWIIGAGSAGNNMSASDVYVLDKNMKTLGAVKDLGKGERIYSVRFLENKGYVVTFRQTDPFFVLDLSNPNTPLLKGELKIPGFSSYLHPVSENKILGIGLEDGKVKITLFDVSSPTSPIEINTYKLDEYYTEASNNHHAFLMDKKHEAFFLPGSQGGYVFSYSGDKLSLLKAISGIEAKRAVYINDNLYVLGDNKMVVLNEDNWEKVKEIEF